MNLILGSGLIGNLARRILGDSWGWIPFKRSRYYSFDIPLADNFVIFDKVVDDFMRQFGNQTPIFMKRPISYRGALMYQDLPISQTPYLDKVYGDDVPLQASALLKTTFTVYPMSATKLYQQLEAQYIDSEITPAVRKYGELVSIDLDKKIATCQSEAGPVKVEFDKIVSTIPLNALYKLCGLSSDIKAKSVCYYHISTDSVDLEGAEYALVADRDIKFFKVYQIKKWHYIFCTFEPLENPLQYFGGFINYRIDIMDARRIEDAFPILPEPDLGLLEAKGIFCVGSNAQWDDFMDVSSCIKRLLSYAAR